MLLIFGAGSFMIELEKYMYRCLQLARKGEGKVAPNPMVGSVLVYKNRIIGEGYHQKYGQAHAEVNCINSVNSHDKLLIPQSVLFVSLEPCAHYGKTPPCADLIIASQISHVVIGCRDPFEQVDGKGIEKLQKAGVKITLGVLEKECIELNKRFFTFHSFHRPFIHLKWAQTLNGKVNEVFNRIEPEDRMGQRKRLLISTPFTNRIVHHWRLQNMAILVGTNTVIADNPELTNRLWPGESPIRLIIDKNLKIPSTSNVLNGRRTTIIFNKHQHTLPFEKVSITDLKEIHLGYYQITDDVSLVHQICNACYQLNIHSILVEGGSNLLQSFFDEEVWDEATVITNQTLFVKEGLPAPQVNDGVVTASDDFDSDHITTIHRKM